MRLHGSHVGIFRDVTADTLCLDNTDKVIVVTHVSIDNKIQPVVEEAGIKTDIKLMLLLVSQFIVFNIALNKYVFYLVCLRAPYL